MTPKGIVLHFTASAFGDAAQINDWHVAQGWSGIGYHYVVLNGIRISGSAYNEQIDGLMEKGRADNIMGAHCKAKSMNHCTLGISSIGTPNRVPAGAAPAAITTTTAAYLTDKQLNTLVTTAAKLCTQYGLDPAGSFTHPTTQQQHRVITQHSQHEPAKPLCASLRIDSIRQLIVNKVNQLRENPELLADGMSIFNLVENPEAVEAKLPEFMTEVGSADGPNDLVTDLNIGYQ